MHARPFFFALDHGIPSLRTHGIPSLHKGREKSWPIRLQKAHTKEGEGSA